ncbi:MAG: hypothetical protein ACYC8V_05625 [Caulobacteraceae bacterium]
MHHRSSLLAGLTAGLLLAGVASAAPSKVAVVCKADFAKLCPTATAVRGAVMRCVKTRLAEVSPDCKSAVETAQARNAARKAAKAAARSAPEEKASSPAS